MELRHLDIKLSRATNLPILPNVTAQMCSLVDKPDVTAADYERIVSQDAALATKIIRAANSPYYRTGRQEITTVHRAVLQLGHRAIRSICMTIAFQSALENKKLDKRFPIGEFWQHSLAVACASKVIAFVIKYPQTEEAFISGLFHDIGKLALWMYLPEDAYKVYELSNREQISHYEAETTLLGLTHQEIGRLAAERWRLPDIYHAPILSHHAPLESLGEVNMLACIVQVGNALADEIGYAFSPFGDANNIHWEISQLFKIEEAQFVPIREAVRKAIAAIGYQLGM